MITAVVDALIAGQVDEARKFIVEIDTAALLREKESAHAATRSSVKKRDAEPSEGQDGRSKSQPRPEAVYQRDSYICRYEHCQRMTIDTIVLRWLSAAFPDEFVYHLHWKQSETHPIYWTHTASFEHLEAWAHGGINDPDNILTACSCCNYAKSDASASDLGWTVTPVPSDVEWSGLTDRLPALEAALAELGVDGPSIGLNSAPDREGEQTSPANPLTAQRQQQCSLSETAVGDLVRLSLPHHVKRRSYCVVLHGDDASTVVEMWREDGLHVTSTIKYELGHADYAEIELLMSPGPEPGSPID